MKRKYLFQMISIVVLTVGLLMANSQAFADTEMFNPVMEMKQTDKELIIRMAIPRMDRDKINVEIKDGMLIISGEHRSETKDKQDTKNNQYSHREESFGSFMQAISLPKDAKESQIDAKYKDGVLAVSVPRAKKEGKKLENEKIRVY